MQHQYHDYGLNDFLEDQGFIDWVRNPDPGSDEFWDNWVKTNPPNLQAFAKATRQLRTLLSTERYSLPPIEQEALRQRIAASIQSGASIGRNQVRGQQSPLHRLYRIGRVAAAVLMFGLAMYGILEWRKQTAGLPGQTVVTKPADIMPGSDKAILTLADGSHHVLDSANRNATIRQGKVTIVQNGDGVAYNDASGGSQSIGFNTITTPRGGQFQLTLSDGTKVWMNAASSIRFPVTFSGAKRQVEITGEAYFEVAHNPAVPFIVAANSTEVKVLGTHFNINAYTDEDATRVTLLEGAVQLSGGNETVKLAPGQQGVAAATLQVVNQVDTEQVLAWKNGSFVFGEGMTVTQIMRQIARWYDVEIRYEGQPKGHIAGSISRNVTLAQVLEILQLTGKADLEIHGRTVIVK